MGWTTADIPDLSGRVAVVTGANSGLGLESARALARAGAHVVMAARDGTKAAEAESDIRTGHAEASLEVVALDLASLASIETAASAIAAAHPRVDILMNNAGLMALPERQTADGFEMQFGVNHLGHWALTAQLLPHVEAAGGRIVTVTSIARHQGKPVDPDNPHLRGTYDPWDAYGRSKLANLVFGLSLHERLAAAGATASSLVAHPGLSSTNLQHATVAESGGEIGGEWVGRAARFGMSPEKGARSQLRAATDPGATSGEFYGPRGGINGAPVRKRLVRRGRILKGADVLWAVSERETGIALTP